MHFAKIKQAIIGARDINIDDTGSIKLRHHKDDKHSLSTIETDRDAMLRREADQAQKILRVARERFKTGM